LATDHRYAHLGLAVQACNGDTFDIKMESGERIVPH
jgi:hypothetical protein